MKRDRQSVNLRHAEMLALIRDRQEVLVEELSETFGISMMTVRRDLQALEEQGKISRFHGGATVGVPAVAADERGEVALCRRQIARRAASLVADGDSLLINGSSTALAILDNLGGKRVSVFTNNGLVCGRKFPPTSRSPIPSSATSSPPAASSSASARPASVCAIWTALKTACPTPRPARKPPAACAATITASALSKEGAASHGKSDDR